MSEKNIYPSNLKNFFLKDHLLDYLNLAGDHSKKDQFAFPECDFSNLMFDLGNKFEDVIIKKIMTECNNWSISYQFVNRKIVNPYLITKEAFELGIDIIFQPFLKDWKYMIVGYPDIIIKKKAFDLLFAKYKDLVAHLKEDVYIVIDVKYSTLPQKDLIFTPKTAYHKFIQAQVLMYKDLVAKTTKKASSVGFLLSKDEGLVQVLDSDDVQKEIKLAISWVQKVRSHWKNWDISGDCPMDKLTNTPIYELYPNMSNQYDTPWRSYKIEISKRFKDISLVSGIGNVLRDRIQKENVYIYSDETFEETLESVMNDSTKRYKNIVKLVDNLNDVQSELKLLNCMDKIKYLYFDIETSYIFEQSREYLVNIGVGEYFNSNNKWMDLEGNWKHSSFFIESLEESSEEKMLESVSNHIKELQKTYSLILIHYTAAENKVLNKLKEKGCEFKNVDMAVCFKYFWERNQDLQKLRLENFKLKTIIQKLTEFGWLDQNLYKDCQIKTGLEVSAIYNKLFSLQDQEYRQKLIKEIDLYNKADCKSLYVLHLLLKSNLLLF